ncbi:Eco57I restriction-modification methylase domain-containing protein [Hugenholtzia roseola]|uniref:Eco57I restriction-modification methylase domain-containing protein n=1 Tax=Hugenholtzia roseola TaxID=1002 RepID=UPI000400B997|nr:N-6 DNA methylase [Hugenholtzia roseola]
MLFQTTILQKYLQAQEKDAAQKERVQTAWRNFKAHFHNPKVQENIRNSKEEQYQGEFLIDLFVKVLGYTKNPNPDFNLTTELKNVKDSKKADGAILLKDAQDPKKDPYVAAVIELKGTQTTDLGKIETQAFGYKNNQPKCTYVLTSNFEKIRLYVENAIEHIEFNLFKLSEKEFQVLYLLLAYPNLKDHLPKRIKEESQNQEDVITKKLYQDYSTFKEQLFENLVAKNPNYEPLLLFKKSQKLLDRFLFIFFAEDRQLLQPHSISEILAQWKRMKNWNYYLPLYTHYRHYFQFLNEGLQNDELHIFPYNGGLFKPDEVLDNVQIDDEILYHHTLLLSEYDFASEVDVNILGHIFENSLHEWEEVKARFAGENTEKKQTKRKKDGIFYTPKFITQYIIAETVGKLCNEKKNDLGLKEEDFVADKKRHQKEKLALLELLKKYRSWLLEITIIDPACGSGAFLNEALNFLIEEHYYIDELQAKLLGDALVLSDVERSILERNLFGVDINEESVEIAKLSLWLRTARPNRKLNDLNQNIKCGNSLLGFEWEKEFAQVFAKGGFDVVIGNPPYVQLQSQRELSLSLEKAGYQTYEKTGDLYCLFYEKGNLILKNGGLLGYITSNKWLRAGYGKSLREYVRRQTQPLLLVDLGAGIFESATVDSNILIFEKTNCILEEDKNPKPFTALDLTKEKDFSDFTIYQNQKINFLPQPNDIWTLANPKTLERKRKIEAAGKPLKDWDVQINYGIKTGYNEAFIIDKAKRDELIRQDPKSAELLKPILRGRDVQRYVPEFADLYLIATFPALNLDIEQYPAIKNYLESFGEKLHQTGESYKDENGILQKTRKKTSNKWFETQDQIGYYQDFEKPKIIYPNMTLYLPFVYDTKGYYINDKGFILTSNNDVSLKYFLVYFNSNFAKEWIRENCPELQGGTRELRKVVFENIPIPEPSASDLPLFESLCDGMLSDYGLLSQLQNGFLGNLRREFGLESLSRALSDWASLSYKDFLAALAKQKVSLSLSQKAEWESYFEQSIAQVADLKQKINQRDAEIEARVRDLYGL